MLLDQVRNWRPAALEQLFERTHEGFWFIDVDGHTIDANPAMCGILGCAIEDLRGKSIFHFVDAENQMIFEREIAARQSGAVTSTYEISITQPSGRRVPCINNASTVFDQSGVPLGSIGLWTDISDQKAIERELRAMQETLADQVDFQTAKLRRSEARLLEALRVARLGSWDIDAEGYLTWSDETYELFGAQKGEMDGTSSLFYERVHPDDRERVRHETQIAWDHGDRYECIHRIVRPGGEIRTVRESAAVIRDAAGITQRLSGTVQDITEQVDAERKLRQAQKMEAIGQLTGGMAHDFNNLLAVITGAAEFLGIEKSYDAELVDTILRTTQRGQDLTARMIAHARQRSAKTERVDMKKLAEGLTGMLRRTLSANILLNVNIHDDLWDVCADGSQIENALLNLAINARDAMPDGGQMDISFFNESLPEWTYAKGPLDLKGDFVVAQVKDNGTGMPLDVLERATEPFFTTKEPDRGSGLGLSMASGFARQSGGEVRISSDPGSGSCVELRLPRDVSDEEETQSMTTTDAIMGQGEKILIIEDDPAVANLTRRILEGLNYTAIVAGDAREARTALESHGTFDLILSDVVLPNGTNGPAFIRDIRPELPDLKVIFMSGYPALSAETDRDIELGGRLIGKPFRREELARAIRTELDTA